MNFSPVGEALAVRKSLIGLYFLALLAAAYLHLQRVQQESANNTVEPVLDYAAMADYAQGSPRKLDDWLQEYKEKYAFQSLAFGEQKLDELEARGEATAMNGVQLQLLLGSAATARPESGKTYIVVLDDAVAGSLEQALKLWDERKVRVWPTLYQGQHKILEVDAPQRTLATLGLGFPSELIGKYAALGYHIWLRPENKPGMTAAKASQALAEYDRLKPDGIIFGGALNEAPGYPDEDAPQALHDYLEKGRKLGLIESDKKAQQKGIEGIVRKSPLRTVRVFATSPAHQNQLKADRVAQMYGLAARERNARVLYIRPFPYESVHEKGEGDANETFFGNMKADIEKRCRLGAASTFDRAVAVPPAVGAVLALGSGAVAWLLLLEWVEVPIGLGVAALAGFAVLGVVGGLTGFGKAQLLRSLLAMGTACCAVMFAAVHHFDEIEKAGEKDNPSAVLASSALVWLKMLLISFSGGFLASSYLQDTTFKLGLDVFRGVKIVTVIVPFLIAVAWMHRQGGLGRMLSLELKLYHLMGLGALFVVAVFYTLRTGNQGGEMSGDAMEAERVVRVVLDQTLGVRPRFKEFLIAHPCMLLAPFWIYLARRYAPPLRALTWVFVLAGSTGLAGLPDTFAHIHTPLYVSIIRCGMGAFFGALLALVYALGLSLAFRLIAPWFSPAVEDRRPEET